MMGRRSADQAQLFYSFNLDERIPSGHLLRRIDGFVAQVLADMNTGSCQFDATDICIPASAISWCNFCAGTPRFDPS